MVRTTAEIQQEITAGEHLATKVKEYFYTDEAWTPKLAFQVGYKMRDIKRAAAKCFPDQHMVSILLMLRNFSKEDFEDLLNI